MEGEWRAKEIRKRGGKWNWEEDELWDVFSLAVIIIICSVVITALGVCCLDQTADGGGQWNSCGQSSAHLCKLPLFNRRRKRGRRKRSEERMWGKEEKRCGAEEILRKQVQWIWTNHTFISCQHCREEEDKREEGKIKESKQSSKEWENIGREVRMRRRNHEEENYIRGSFLCVCTHHTYAGF